jgi:hypothetical protein
LFSAAAIAALRSEVTNVECATRTISPLFTFSLSGLLPAR